MATINKSGTNKTAATPVTAANKTRNSMKCAQNTNLNEYASDCCLTDKDIISDVLGSQKSLITLYGTALCESSCKNMRDLVATKLTECASDQFDMFLYMNERGMYPTDPAPAQKVQQMKTKYNGESQKMKK